ncbi:hypothetical protein [Membranihabitans marinus]|uniref:hypothetical protein n=1 Tax=Membranihabitans marinus TaxID=1227546 RepID=UPI001F47167D|nr:hypothetical protein [Membranihabitans marinus]
MNYLMTYLVYLWIPFSTINPVNEALPSWSSNERLSHDIEWMLNAPELKFKFSQKVRISLFVTADRQMVVLKTDARKKKIDGFIKSRLNYKKIKIADIESDKIYTIKVDFELNGE